MHTRFVAIMLEELEVPCTGVGLTEGRETLGASWLLVLALLDLRRLWVTARATGSVSSDQAESVWVRRS